MLMLVTNVILLNSPAKLLNGYWLTRLVNAQSTDQFNVLVREISLVFNLKTETTYEVTRRLFVDYVFALKDKYKQFGSHIDKLIKAMVSGLDDKVKLT